MVVKNHGYPSVCRMSVIKSPEFKQVLTLNDQDVAALFLEVLQLGGKTGYMSTAPCRSIRRSATRSTRRSSASPPSSRPHPTR